MKPEPLDPAFKAVRRVYLIYYILAFPLFYFTFPIVLMSFGGEADAEWSLRFFQISGIAFLACYIGVRFWAPRITNPRRAWLPFGAHMLVVGALLACIWSSSDRIGDSEDSLIVGIEILYMFVLLGLLAIGIYIAISSAHGLKPVDGATKS